MHSFKAGGKMKFWHYFPLFTLMLIISIGCAAKMPRPPAGLKPNIDNIIVIPGVKDFRFENLTTSAEVNCAVLVQYPAQDFITTLRGKLKSHRWIPMENSFLNPGLSSSHVDGWRKYGDPTRGPFLIVYEWVADWENDKGEVITYALRYYYPKDQPPDLHTLHVQAIYYPKNEVDALKTQIPVWNQQSRAADRARKDKIRSESKHSGEITIRLAQSGWSPSQGAVQFDSKVDPLILKVAAVEVINDIEDNPVIQIILTGDAAVRLKKFTANNLERFAALIVEEEVIWVAIVKEEVEDIVIKGEYMHYKAKEVLKRIMKY
jgi:hypothetical protein